MNPKKPPPPGDANEEISALIETLHQTGQRLEELTAGEVDTVADRDGRTFMLRRAQDQLRHSEAAKQAAILNALPAHIALLDTQGRIISVNEAWRRFGSANVLHGPGQEIGLNYLEICDSARGDDASDAHQVAAGIRSVLGGGAKSFSIEYPCQSPTEQRWFLLTVTPLADDHRNGAVVMHLNITERKRAEENLRARELRYAAVTASANDALVTADAAGRIVGWNPSAERIFGYAETEVIGQPLTLLIPQRFQDRHLDGMKRVQSGGERRVIGKAVEVVGRRKDASEFPLELSLAEWSVGAGQFFTGFIRDITERKRIEKALRNSEAELKAAQRVARIGNWYLALATGAVSWSEEIYRVFDRDPGLPPPTYAELGQLLTVASAERMNAAIENSKQTGAPYETDLEVLRADDPNKWIAAHGEVVRDDNGQIVGLRGTAQDISERKAQELKIARLSRIQAVLSGINSLIVRVRDRNELFKEACRIAVEVGAFRMAWIGVIDPQTRDGKVVAWHGGKEGYLDKIRLTARDGTPDSERPACRALRQMQPVICNDIATEPSLAALWDDLLKRGHKSAACFPLTVAGRAEAVIALFAGELDFFDDEETRLLLELAGDISFALDHIDKQERLCAAEEQFRGLVEQSIAGIYIIQDDKLAYVNPRFAEIRGFGSADELIGRDPLPLIAEKDRGNVAENRRRLLSGEAQSMNYSFTALRNDGSTVEVGVSSTRATYCGRPAIIGMMQDISEKMRSEEQIQRHIKQLKTALMSTVEVATILSEMRDPYTAGHERRVAEIAAAIGTELGFDDRRIEGLQVAGHLHDVGKITIPSEILSKPGKLSAIEFQLVKGHARASYDVLKGVEFPWPVAEVALQHHERMDGSGYPQGLKGEEILLEARIMAVADVVEAMSSHRPYRPGLGIEKALAEIERGRETAYDADAADACLRLFREKRYQLPT